MKKFLALLLALIMTLSVCLLVACGGGNGDTPTDTPDKKDDSGEEDSGKGDSGEDDPEAGFNWDTYITSLYDKYDYADETINLLTNGGTWYYDADKEINEGDALEYAIYTRSRELEAGLGITFGGLTGETGVDNGTFTTYLTADNGSNTNAYDIISGHMKFNATCATLGYCYNLDKLPVIDFSMECWNDNICSMFEYKKTRYWATGDITTGFIDNIVAVYVYDELWTAKIGTIAEMYQMVNEGKWTLEKMGTVCADIYVDDGDGSVNDGDTFGLVYEDTGWVMAALASGAGFNYTKQEGSKYVLDLASTSNETVFSEVKKALFNTKSIYCISDPTSKFMSGTSMLFYDTMDTINGFRTMEADYSIIPMPKLSEESEYRSPSYDGIRICGINHTVIVGQAEGRPEMVGVVFQALAATGLKYVTEANFEISLKTKYTRNPESAEILEKVKDSAYSDFAFCWTGPLGEIDYFISNAIMGKSTSLAVKAASDQSAYETKLKSLYSILGTLAREDGAD